MILLYLYVGKKKVMNISPVPVLFLSGRETGRTGREEAALQQVRQLDVKAKVILGV